MAIPAVITTNTTARATDTADVNLSESEMMINTMLRKNKEMLIMRIAMDVRIACLLADALERCQRGEHAEGGDGEDCEAPVPPVWAEPSFYHAMVVHAVGGGSREHVTFVSRGRNC